MTFYTPDRINPRTKSALDEMGEAGVITVEQRGKALFYKSTKEKMGIPKIDFEPIQESESFPIVDEL